MATPAGSIHLEQAIPETVLGAFDRASSRFLDSLGPQDRKEFETTPITEASIRAHIHDMEKEQGNRGSLCNMRRLEPFIRFVSQYTKVIEVLIQAKPDVLSLLWGPLKLLLQVAESYMDAFESLLSAFQQIGENAPRFARYATLFRYNARMQEVIALVYEDILHFYRRVLKFFRCKAWKILFRLTWADFQARFRNLLNNMRRHQELIDNEAQAEAIAQAVEARENEQAAINYSLKKRLARKRKACLKWLSPADVETPLSEAVDKQTPGTGEWLQRSSELQMWFKGKTHLWLHGKPGAGKTILSASIVKLLQSRKDPVSKDVPILYFYCSYKPSDRNTCIAVLRTLIAQLVQQVDQLISYVYDQYITSPQPPTLPLCKVLFYNLIEAATTANERLYLVIDGLDELPAIERAQLQPVLKRILGSTRPRCDVVSVFVTSQDLSDIRSTMKSKTSGASPVQEVQVGSKNSKDIELYIRDVVDQYVDSHEEDGLEDVEPNIREQIRQSLSLRAEGMFLYVWLVMEGLLQKTSIGRIKRTLETLPQGLNKAYERILDRIYQFSAEETEIIVRVLGWVSTANRPLTMSELQDACAIFSDQNSRTIDPHARPLRSLLRNGCGPIVEVTGNDTLDFVHGSVREYLIDPQCRSTPVFQELQAHQDMAIVCASYLHFRCFEPGVTEAEARAAVINGDLQLCDYVQLSWVKHSLEAYKSQQSNPVLDGLLSTFFDVYLSEKARNKLRNQQPRPLSLGNPLVGTEQSKMLPAVKDGISLVLHYRKKLRKMAETAKVPDDPTTFYKSRNYLREVLEAQLEDNPDQCVVEKLGKLYGRSLYKCRHAACTISVDTNSASFETPIERVKHEERHHDMFWIRCTEEECGMPNQPSIAALRRHKKQYHTPAVLSEDGHVKNLDILKAAVLINRRIDKNRAIPYQNKVGSDWSVLFNPQVPRTLDVNVIHTLEHASVVCSVSFSADGKYIATGGNRSTHIYDVFTGEKVMELRDDLNDDDDNTTSYIRCVRFSPDIQHLATGAEDSRVRVWDIHSRRLLHTLHHEAAVYAIDYAPNGRHIASCSGDRTVRIWDIGSGQTIHILNTEGNSSVAFSSDGKLVAAGSQNCRSIVVWDTESGYINERLDGQEGHHDGVHSVAFFPSGRQLVSGSLDKTIKVWDLPLASPGIQKQASSRNKSIKTLEGHEDFVLGVAVTPDGKWVLSSSKDNSMKFWDPNTSSTPFTLNGHKDPVISVATSPIEGLFATGGGDKKVRIWRYETYRT